MGTVNDMLSIARSKIGYSESNGKFRSIIDGYNSAPPVARGYKVKYTDEWCATFVSFCGIKSGNRDLIGTECSCEKFIDIFKKKGIWIEDGTITPQIGDIILYNWDFYGQPNNGFSDHIGIVENVIGNKIIVIEGNMNEAVGRREIPLKWGYIRGYARPKYEKTPTTNNNLTVNKVAHDVIAGKYGNGEERIKKIKALGLDPYQVQQEVNNILKGNKIEQIAKDVIAGKYGNGSERVKNLKKLGVDPDAVQIKVNELLRRG